MPNREQNSNKGTFGKVLNFCGSNNYFGAAYLSTISSLKVGAGFSALASDYSVIKSVSTLLPEAVYYTHKEAIEIIKNFSVILVGCGLGLNKASTRLFKQIIKQLQKETMPVIIDADGLTLLAQLRVIEHNYPLILTPHPLEGARLLKCSLDEVLNDIEGAAKEISTKYNCITVLKTHRTVVCNNNLELHTNNHGNSALAKAGSGDVLAGIIAGLLAQKMPPFEASKLGVYLHSRAGEIASEEMTEYSVLASDLPQYLHKAIKELI